MLTGDRVNPVRDETVGPIESAPLNPLVQAHGIFMTIAWPILAVTGIFFAAWMRPALPNGEWFQVSPPSSFLETVCLYVLMDSSSLLAPSLLSLFSLPFFPPLPSLFPLSPSRSTSLPPSLPPLLPSLGSPCSPVRIFIFWGSRIHSHFCRFPRHQWPDLSWQ